MRNPLFSSGFSNYFGTVSDDALYPLDAAIANHSSQNRHPLPLRHKQLRLRPHPKRLLPSLQIAHHAIDAIPRRRVIAGIDLSAQGRFGGLRSQELCPAEEQSLFAAETVALGLCVYPVRCGVQAVGIQRDRHADEIRQVFAKAAAAVEAPRAVGRSRCIGSVAEPAWTPGRDRTDAFAPQPLGSSFAV